MRVGIEGLVGFDLENPVVFCLVHQRQKTQSDAKSDWVETKINESGATEAAAIAEQHHTACRKHCPS
jgi:hypothetical protein